MQALKATINWRLKENLKKKKQNLIQKKSIKFLHLQIKISLQNVIFLIFYSETGSTTVLPSLVRSFKRLPLVGLFSTLTQLQNILKKGKETLFQMIAYHFLVCKIYCKKFDYSKYFILCWSYQINICSSSDNVSNKKETYSATNSRGVQVV